jgi:hypothetical protein
MFPLIAMIASAALSDAQHNQERGDAHRQTYEDTLNKINRTRAQQLGAQPYSFMVNDMKNANYGIDKAANASSNNNIGAMLASYFMRGIGGGSDEKFGDDYESSFLKQPNLQYNASEDGIGTGDVMGKAQTDPWDKDPWGDAGF